MSGRKTYINPYAKGNNTGMSTSQLGGSGSSNTATDGDGAAAAAAATLSTNTVRPTTRSSPKKNTTNNASTSCAGKSDDINDVLLSGLAPSTKAGNDSAEKLAAIFRKHMDYAPTMHAEEFEGEDMLRIYVSRYFRWLSTRLIPTNFTDELKPSNPSNKKCCTIKTLLGYVGKHVTRIRTQFKPADYEGLKEKEHPEWYTLFRKYFAAECERLHVVTMGAGDDIQFGDLDTRPLYREMHSSEYSIINAA